MFQGKVVLVTGGTGSFGRTFAKRLLRAGGVERILIFSRDEKKQHDMRLAFADPRLSFHIGDIRDRERVRDVMSGVDYVFHAAALKQVPSCEFFPLEAVKTNVLGASNVMDAAGQAGVKTVVVLSTDKAVYPINAMGLSKALMEKLMVAKGLEGRSETVYCAVRYGNVLGSRGSVVPLFMRQGQAGEPLTVTNPEMTRFLLHLEDAVELVELAIEKGQNGDVFVKKAPAATIADLAQACINLTGGKSEVKTIGIREGEKVHETLVTREDLLHSEDLGGHYRIRANKTMDWDEYLVRGQPGNIPPDGYTSANTTRLSVAEIETLLRPLESALQSGDELD